MRTSTLRTFLFIAVLAPMLSGCYILRSSNYFVKATEAAPYDAVIVPGVPYADESMSGVMKIRVHWAAYLYRKGITRNIIFSGGAVHTPYIEARVMANYAEALGVPPEHIQLEPLAQHSTENLFYGWKRARELGYNHVALATDPFQAGMLKQFNGRLRRELGAQVDLVPIVFRTLKTLDLRDPVFDVSDCRVADFTPLDAREGFFQRLKGTFGGNIDLERERATQARARDASMRDLARP
ncbi:MAG: YdcF family protein [Flavobacteriales bacterium]|nr:YdcF family protein [Flavobacteriales bacterium]MCB9166315.1 YdcF family protein [Flavobacteriales bacterium]